MSSRDPIADGAGTAGHLVLVIDGALPAAAQQACADAAATLAAQTGMPVIVAVAPVDRLDTLRETFARDVDVRRREHTPPSRPDPAEAMSSAPFVWQEDGRPDWGRMWTTFCDLALYGGPPQRGTDRALRAPAASTVRTDDEMLAEMRRGIWETTGLYAEPGEPGWLAITCDSPTMAAWLCAAIILENVDARVDEDRLLVPAGPDFELKDQVKSIITVVAKTHHYWRAHIAGSERP